MQIEDGGDSPEVNRLLLDALRAGIRHQVDERTAQPALQAVDQFEQAESVRRRGVRAGQPGARVVPPDDGCDV